MKDSYSSLITLHSSLTELLFLLCVAAVIAWQIFTAPVIGLADNGDFPRVMRPFGIGYRNAADESSAFGWFVQRYRIHPTLRLDYGYLTSESALIAVAVPLNRATFGRRTFDIRSLGAIHLVAMLACCFALMRLSSRWRSSLRWPVLIGAAMLFTDTAYVGFFNSFYTENASLLFLLGSTIAAIAMLQRPTTLRMIVFAVLSGALVMAKPQNAPAGILLALLLVRAGIRSPSRRLIAAITATAMIAFTIFLYMRTPRYIGDWTRMVAVFHELFAHSPDPAADARALGIDPSLVRYTGTHPWSPGAPQIDDAEFRRSFLDRLSMSKLALFYLARPARMANVVNRISPSAFEQRLGLGNFQRETGRPAGSLSYRFAAVSSLKNRLLPRSGITLGIVLVGALAVIVANWRQSEIPLILYLIGVTQLALVAMTQGEIDAVKHLFLFRIAFDLLLLWGLAAILARLNATRGKNAAGAERRL